MRVGAVQELTRLLLEWWRRGATQSLVGYELCRLLVEDAGYAAARLESLAVPSHFSPIVYAQSRECVACLERFARTDAGRALRQALVLNGQDLPHLARPNPPCINATVAWRCADDTLALSVCLEQEQPNADELAALRQALAATCPQGAALSGDHGVPVSMLHISSWMPHGLLTVRAGKLAFANHPLAQRLGYVSPEELLAARVRIEELLAPEELAAWRDFVVLLHQVPAQQSIERRFRLRRADGATWTALLRCVTSEAGLETVSCSVLDSSMPAADAMTTMETLSRAVLALSRARTFDELIHEITRQARLIVPADATNVFLYRGDAIELAARDGYEHLPLKLEQPTSFKAPHSFSTFQYMTRTREPLLIEDTLSSEWWTLVTGTETLRSYIGIPLVVRGQVIGFLNVDGLRPHQFTMHDVQRLRLFADYAAAMLEQVRLVETLATERNRFELLYKVALSLSASLDVETVGARALELLQEAFGALNVIIYLWDDEEKVLRPLCGFSRAHAMQLEHIPETFKRKQRGLALWVFDTGKPALVPDVSTNPHWVYVPGVDDWVQSALDVPLTAHGQTIGVLSLLAEQRGAFDEDDLRLLEVISIPLALALQNALFYKQAEQRARSMAEALQQKEELERVKQRVIEDVAHELRTPVAIIQGYAEALLQQALGEMSPEQTKVMEVIERRARMLNGLIESMMLLWQAEEDTRKAVTRNFEAVNVGVLVQEVVEDFREQALKAALTLVSSIGEGELWGMGNALLLRRVVDNLISNALKFTPAGRQVMVRVERQDERLVLEVCDEGIGIPPDKLEQVFDRFYRVGDTRLKRKGLGLGLALVKTIVEAHGGTVRAISPVTADPEYPGTCLRVELPALAFPGAGAE